MPEKTATGHYRRMTMYGLSSGGQDCNAVGQHEGTVTHVRTAKATAVRPTHMQVIERVHASKRKRKRTWSVGSHQSAGEACRSWSVALLRLPTKQAGQQASRDVGRR
jgi:hypothetical protein